jgi:hypothetical protein
MAYTNSPENNTYRTVDLEFTATPWPRNNTVTTRRDPEITNMFFDRNSNENQTKDFVLSKRPGLQDTGIGLNKSTSVSIINGFFQDSNTGYIYWSVNNQIIRYNGSGNQVLATMSGTTPTTMNSVGFCMFLNSSGTRYLMVNNGAQLWYHDVTTNTATQVTDADYPGTTSPQMVFLDGYLFVIKTDTGDIYNSDLDDPTSWTPGNYITSEINPDFALTLAKVKNYLVCFGTDGVEFFYDAANPSGSPLGRNESYYQPVTLQSSVCNVGDSLYFVGRLYNNTSRFYRLDGNSLTALSPSWVDRYLAILIGVSYGEDQISKNLVFTFSSNGHHFIGINLYTDFILVYDINEGFWYRWSFGTAFNGNSNRIELAVKDINDDRVLFATGNQTSFSALDEQIYQDFNVNFTASYQTQDFDGGTFNWKSCHRVALHCDYPTTSATSNAKISWSDDDGNTFSTPRDISVTTNNPYITQCGRFRTRNWKITYEDNYPFRLWGLSMDLNIGTI